MKSAIGPDLSWSTGSAFISECGRYRYNLRRGWASGPTAVLPPSLMCLTSTKDGHSAHPLMMPYSRVLRPWPVHPYAGKGNGQ